MPAAPEHSTGHDGAVSTSWTSPDPRRTVTGTAFGRPYERVEPVAPPLAADVRAGLVTFAVTVLAGAPVGLLWALLAPGVAIRIEAGSVALAETYGDGFIAVDGYFFVAVVLAGLIGGLVAWWLGSRHGPAVVLALAAGGLVAAYVAMVVGEQVGLEDLRAVVDAGTEGRFVLALDLKATPALVGWPVASLVAYAVGTLLRDRSASSG